MKNLINFFKWYGNTNPDLAVKIDIPEIMQRVNAVPFFVSTFKNRSAQVKENFNYQFNFKNR